MVELFTGRVEESRRSEEGSVPELTADHVAIYRLGVLSLGAIASGQFAPAPLTTEHTFVAGTYARTLIIPAGTFLTGAVHSHDSFFVVRAGALLVTDGNREAVAVGPGFMSVTKAGTSRAGIAVTDCVVTTFHSNPDNLTDPDELWEAYTLPPPANLLEILSKPELEVAV